MENASSEKSLYDIYSSSVSGQLALFADETGYDAIALDNPDQERFCWEYVLRKDNGTQAYKAVKPHVKDSSARAKASKWLTCDNIKGRIAEIRDELLRQYRVTADELMQFHGRILKLDREAFVDRSEDGKLTTLKPLNKLDAVAASIVELKGVSALESGDVVVAYSVPERFKSAQELAKILGLNKERKEISGPDGGPIVSEGIVASDTEKLEMLRNRFDQHGTS